MSEKLTALQARFVEEYLLDADRFWSKVDRRDDDDCWEFTGANDAGGYGRFHIGLSRGSCMLAHRVSFGLTNGFLPEAVCHRCDNPKCCNPNHLFAGTRAINNADMASKGRNRVPRPSMRGEKHHQAKITDDEAATIRERYSSSEVTQRSLAREYGVSQRSIAKVVNGVSFRNVQ